MKSYVYYFIIVVLFLVGYERAAYSENWRIYRDRGYIEQNDILPESLYISYIETRYNKSRYLMVIKDGMDCSCLNLANQKFTNVEIHDANFRCCRFVNDVDMRQGVFVNCDFSDAVFEGVTMDEHTLFINCKGNEVKKLIEKQKASRVPFLQVKETLVSDSIDDYTVLNNVECCDVDPSNFSRVTLKGFFFNMNGKQLRETNNAKHLNYRDIRVSWDGERYCDYVNYDFSNALVVNCSFYGCDFTGASFDDACFDNVNFQDSVISLDQIKSTWNYKNHTFDNVILPSKLQAALDWEEFQKTVSFKEKKLLDQEYGESSLTRALKIKKRLMGLREIPELLGKDSFESIDMKFFDYYDVTDWDLSNIDFSHSYIGTSCFKNANFTDAIIQGVCFQAKRRHFQSDEDVFTREQLESTKSFKIKKLNHIKFSSVCDLRGIDFSNFDLSNSTFQTDMSNVNFEDAIITGCTFIYPEIYRMSGTLNAADRSNVLRNCRRYEYELRKQLERSWNYKTGKMESVVIDFEPSYIPRDK